MKDILAGYKTKTTGWILAAIPIAGMMGYDIDPEAVQLFLERFWGWVAAGFAGLGALNHWFRNLADK